jgi:hypothetical protein
MDDEQRATFTADANAVHQVLDQIRRDASIPFTELSLVVADDFTASVRAHQRDPEQPFDSERPFGRVSAKNLAQDDVGERVVIVFDSRAWASQDAGYDRWQAIGTIAHELAHPILERARHASGVLDGVTFPSHLPGELARSISRIGFDEYRADEICDVVLASVSTKVVGGTASPAVTWDIEGPGWLKSVRDLYASLYPRLPDVVQSYRERRLDLLPMWREVLQQSEAIVTAFMHARAHADHSDAAVAILEAEEIRDLPFVRLYLSDTMPPYLEAVRTGPVLAPLSEYAAVDHQVVVAGEKMLREIWRRLGLTFTENIETREFGMHVTAPVR